MSEPAIRPVAAKPEPVVFLLWGNYARKKAAFDEARRRADATWC